MRITFAILGLCLLAACVSDARPSNCGEPTARIEITVSIESMTPSKLDVCRDQDVTLVIASQVDGFLHVHGYDEVVGVTEISTDDTREVDFKATRAGQFPIELHPGSDPTGIEVGILTVHEP
ncbi:MAG: hypothetical protein IT340_00360 [Chloroflexi bacterium]|nr:hypothetical protein [Chloroflexota bacterium]